MKIRSTVLNFFTRVYTGFMRVTVRGTPLESTQLNTDPLVAFSSLYDTIKYKNKVYFLYYFITGKKYSPSNMPLRLGGEFYTYTLSLTSELDTVRWSTPRPSRFSAIKHTVPIVQEAGWDPGPVWTGAKKSLPHRLSNPDPSSPQRVAIPTALSRPTFSQPHSV